MSAPCSADADDFLAELDRLLDADGTGAEGLCYLSATLSELTPQAGACKRLLEQLSERGRFQHFARDVAELLDLTIDRACALLDGLADPAGWASRIPDTSFLSVDGGPRVAGAVCGFVHMRAGVIYPNPDHFADEHVFVLQGAYEDLDRGVWVVAGERDHIPPGRCHTYRVPADGPDLLKVVVLHKGLRVPGEDWHRANQQIGFRFFWSFRTSARISRGS